MTPREEGASAAEISGRYRGMITSGLIGAGERLPTVRQAASDLGVAPGTVAKAYRLLEAEGLVVTRTAAGTRVSDSAGALPAAVVRRIRRLVDDARAAGVDEQGLVDAVRALWREGDRV